MADKPTRSNGELLDLSRPTALPELTPAISARHLPGLDGIRGIAIIWVVFHNTLDDSFAPNAGPLHFVALLAHAGWMGVQLFFALSGFLITSWLLDTQGASNYFSAFYARRALRILPLYYGVLFALLVILPRFVGSNGELATAVASQLSLWLFVINWTQAPAYGFVHFWSLAVEEQFYLLWPFVAHRLAPRRLLAVCSWIAVAAIVVRTSMVLHGASWWTIYSQTTCRMDALALGAAGACVIRIPSTRTFAARWLNWLGSATFIIFLIGIPLTRMYDREGIACETIGYTWLAWCSALLVTGVAITDGDRPPWTTRALRSPPLRSFGKYSYAIYIFHELIHKLLGQPWTAARLGAHPPIAFVFAASLVTLAVSYGLAFLSYHGFEKHFLRLKRFARPIRLETSAALSAR